MHRGLCGESRGQPNLRYGFPTGRRECVGGRPHWRAAGGDPGQRHRPICVAGASASSSQSQRGRRKYWRCRAAEAGAGDCLRPSPPAPASAEAHTTAPKRRDNRVTNRPGEWNHPDRAVCSPNMHQVDDRPWGLAALAPAITITLLLALSFGVFTLISVEDAVCTFSAALARIRREGWRM